MKNLLCKNIENRLLLSASAGLLVFSTITGIFAYRYTFQNQLEQAASLQQQLVNTVQVQAEIAAFTRNKEIAEGVVNGLLANPTILAVSVTSTDGFKLELGSRMKVDFKQGTSYPLYSPTDHLEQIGTISIIQDSDHVSTVAMRTALFQTSLMLLLVFVAVAILAVLLRRMVLTPILKLTNAMQVLQPGDKSRIATDETHQYDQIGQLSNSINNILQAFETAIAKIESQRSDLERLSTHDYLTGLPTMRLVDDRLQIACRNAIRSQCKVALLFIDLDGFKFINDKFGHEAGDEVLKQVAQRLLGGIRSEDTAARVGGDEFVVILGRITELNAAAQVAQNLISSIAKPFEVAGQSMFLGASIGIAIFPDHTDNTETMRRIADTAMYKIKRDGKGNYAFADADRAVS